MTDTLNQKAMEFNRERYPMESSFCRRHGRYTDEYGDCIEDLSGPGLGSMEWDAETIRIKEGREKK